MLALISQPDFYHNLAASLAKLLAGLQQRADAAGIPFTTTQVGGMFGLYFSKQKDIRSFDDVMACDAAERAFARLTPR